MKKIIMVEYKGHSDRYNNLVGHQLKFIQEYYGVLKEYFDVNLIATKNYVGELKDFKFQKILNHNVDITTKNVVKKILNFGIKLFNVNTILSNLSKTLIWFCDPDIVFFIYLCLFGSRSNKIICTLCIQEYNGNNLLKNNFKNFFLKRALKKIDLILKTNRRFTFINEKAIYIPDFFYNERKYTKYIQKKKNQVVCLGTMNHQKLLEEAIEVFKNIEIELIIIGSFYDKERYKNLIKDKYLNIHIEDRYLEADSYYQLIGESKFILLPYNEIIYKNRTTGVAVEAIFLDTIPIAPKSILKCNSIKGVGYTNLTDLLSVDFKSVNVESYFRYNKEIINKYYRGEAFIEGFSSAINLLIK